MFQPRREQAPDAGSPGRSPAIKVRDEEFGAEKESAEDAMEWRQVPLPPG
jgi:hypothetical protein